MQRRFVALAAAAIFLVGCADVTTSAIDVNGETTGRSELLDLMVDLRPPDAPDDPVTLGCSQRDTAVAVTIQNELLRDELARRGGAVDDADRAAGALQADQLILGPTGLFTEDARAFVEETIALREALARLVAPDPVDPIILELQAGADVEIDPRFGSWVDGRGFEPVAPCFG